MIQVLSKTCLIPYIINGYGFFIEVDCIIKDNKYYIPGLIKDIKKIHSYKVFYKSETPLSFKTEEDCKNWLNKIK